MKRRYVAVVGVIGAGLAGCGGSSSNHADRGGGGTGGGGGDAGTVCADYANEYCARVAACAPGYLTLVGFAGVADCSSYYQTTCALGLAALHSANTPALTQQCGDQLGAMTCTELLGSGTAPACLPHGGTFANGDACNSPWQCSSGRCFTQALNNCGTCVPAIASGQPCANTEGFFGSGCADNLVCALATLGATTPVCTAPVAMGAACADSGVCPVNATCDGTTHVCTALPAIGQSCDPSTIYYCDPTKAGALCDSTTSLCKATSLASPGGACGTVSGATVTCNGACNLPTPDAGAGTCSPYLAAGQPCTAGDLCLIGTTCTGAVCTAMACDGTPVPASGSDAAADAEPTDAGGQ
jgi:hypothetical protein